MDKRKKIIIIISVVVGVICLVGLITPSGISSAETYKIINNPFEVAVQSKGELKGEKMKFITLPAALSRRDLRLYRLEIKDLVPEGTMVKKGDYVALIDRKVIEESMKKNENRLDERNARLKDARIDSTIKLNQAREEVRKAILNLEEKKYDLDIASYESEAFQRKAQIYYNKAKRNLEKKRRDLELRRISLAVRVSREEHLVKSYDDKHKKYLEAIKSIRIKAPAPGMVMYARRWNGRKIKEGDQISMWEPEIATLPDLSRMVSESFVKEIDIAKISVGDSVSIKVDALPGKLYYGEVIKIANVGQEFPGEDTKVFKVFTRLSQTDESLKPYMTTNNQIISSFFNDTLIVPLKYVFSEDQLRYVFLKDGSEILKQEVELGDENEESAIIKAGLSLNDVILCAQPNDTTGMKFSCLN